MRFRLDVRTKTPILTERPGYHLVTAWKAIKREEQAYAENA